MLGLKQNTSYFGALFKISLLILTFFLSCFALAAEKPKVFSSIRPLALVVQDLAGDLVESHVLVDGSASPHDFSLTIAQALKLSEANLLVWVGPKFESFLNKGALPKQNVTLSELVKVDHEGHDHNHDHTHDMHLWLGSEYIALLAEDLSVKLKAILPKHAAAIDERLRNFHKALQERTLTTTELLSAYVERPFAVHHDGYGEYVHEYNLFQVANLTSVPHERLSARKLQVLGDGMARASCLLAEKGEKQEAERYAKLFEKPLVLVDLLATDRELQSYDAYLAALSKSFLECLTQKRP